MKNISKDNIRLEDILDTAPIAVAWSSVTSGRIEHINKAFSALFGYVLQDLPDLNTWFSDAFADASYYQQVVEPWIQDNQARQQDSVSMDGISARMLRNDGTIRKINLCVSTLGEKRLWYFNDITEHWIAERRLRARSKMLEMVAKSSALKDILKVIVKQIQQESPLSLCSVLLFDPAEQCLRLGAAPDLPDCYNQAVDGIKIGLNVGSCGTAAHLNKRVIVEDIATHPYWQYYTQLAAEAGLAACWSDPIVSSKGDLLGTFAIYKRLPSFPTQKEIELINFASNLASIAIESHSAQETLQKRAYYDHLTGLANRGYFFQHCDALLKQSRVEGFPLAIIMMDVDHFKEVNDKYGHKVGDFVLQKLAQVSVSVLKHTDVIARIGGEEFAILLPFTDNNSAVQSAEQLREAIASSVVWGSNHERVRFTVSLGVAFRQNGECTVDEILNKADKALYQAKAAGRNCVFVLDDQNEFKRPIL